MNLLRSYEYFNPNQCKNKIHIIGCGAVGSTLAENLVRLGLTNITIYDHDKVESHNIANQMFRAIDIGKHKVEAMQEILFDINPDLQEANSGFRIVSEKYEDQQLYGYVFLCVDNIEIRRTICENNKFNLNILGVFDFRIAATDGQVFAAEWRKDSIEWLLSTMQFSHEEAVETAPVSACNSPLSLAPAIRDCVAIGVANFMNFAQGKPYKKMIETYTFDAAINSFSK